MDKEMEIAREVRTLFEMYAFKGVGTHVVDSRQDDNLLFFLDVNLYILMRMQTVIFQEIMVT